MSGVSTKDVKSLVVSEEGKVHIDLEMGVFEIVRIEGFDSKASAATGCLYVRDCTAKEIALLRRAMAANMITRRPCKTPCGTLPLAVMSSSISRQKTSLMPPVDY